MQTMGQRFKAAREKKRISLSDAAKKTHLKIQHLEAMERDDFSKMPAPIYARGFIRTYSGLLGLDPAPLLREYTDVHGGGKRPAIPVDAKIIKNVPGEEPLPTGKLTDDVMQEEPTPGASSTGSKSDSAPFDFRTLAVGGAIVAVILLVIAAVKFWPAQSGGVDGSRIVEVKRPVGKTPLAVMREPPDPYIEISGQGGRTP